MNEYYVCLDCGYIVTDDDCEWYGLFPMHESCHDKRIARDEYIEELRQSYTGEDA